MPEVSKVCHFWRAARQVFKCKSQNNLYSPRMFILKLQLVSCLHWSNKKSMHFLGLCVSRSHTLSPVHRCAFDQAHLDFHTTLEYVIMGTSLWSHRRARSGATIPHNALARQRMSNHPSRRCNCPWTLWRVLQYIAGEGMRGKSISKQAVYEPRNTEREIKLLVVVWSHLFLQ